MKKKSKSKFLKLLISFFVVVVLCIFFIANHFHKKIFQPNISINSSNSGVFVEIPTGSDFDDVIEILSEKGILVNYNSFKWVSDKKNYIYNKLLKKLKYTITFKLFDKTKDKAIDTKKIR